MAQQQLHMLRPQTALLQFTEHDRLRHQSTIGALSRRSYRHAFEPGCGSGELTAQLAGMCDRVTAMDISGDAVARTRTRCAHWGNVHVHCADIRSSVPAEPVDLIVFSEIGFYFSAPELIRIVRALASRIVPGGEFVAVHCLPPSEEHVLHADAVHCQLLANLPLRWTRGERDGGLLIDSWRLPH
jgi:16S rRNA A1518/A1519 N6-dimethyltransferase RsmA/KsgA/DIM1 with predicted DNA glycosylase/AP lyase activity